MSKERTKPVLRSTKNYDLFVMHRCNRPLREDRDLLASMKEHKFLPSSPIHCRPNGDGRLLVVRGHHRLHYAKRLGLSVWYIVDPTQVEIFDLEGSRKAAWSTRDFAEARARSGDKHCAVVLEFASAHEIPLSMASGLVGGLSAADNVKARGLKTGRFRVGDMRHANAVVGVIGLCRDHAIPFAGKAAFINAISRVLCVPEVSIKTLRTKIKTHGAKMRERRTRDEYLEELEELYNYQTKGRRLPVKFRAIEIARSARRLARETRTGGTRAVGGWANRRLRSPTTNREDES